jgi:hypothetical protein
MRRSLILTVVLVALGATVALARSVATTQSVTDGKTAQKGGAIEVIVYANPAKTAERPVVGATYMSWIKVHFTCGQGEGEPTLYEVTGNAGKRYDYGKSFTFTRKAVPVYEAETSDKTTFKAAVTVKGRITKTSKKATSGKGTVTVEAPGCSTGALKWSGKGRFMTAD